MTSGDILTHLVHSVDRLDWDGVRACFADTVDVDYSELSGATDGPTPADELVAQWQSLLPGFIATQHLLGPVVVDGQAGSSVAHAHVRAWHYLPASDPWVVAGHYEASLDAEDRIDGLTLRVFHVDGPDDASERATERAKTDPRS